MTAPGPNGWLMETNILIHLARKDRTGDALRAGHDIVSGRHPTYACVVSRGEADSFALCNDWGARRCQRLTDSFDQLHGVLDISPTAVIDEYARIDHASRSIGRRMGKNDLWIAAVAVAYQLTLLTTDADFDHLAAAGWLAVVRQPVLP